MAVVNVDGLCHRFGRQRVLNKVGFQVERGDCLVLFGANGSGKSTLLSLLATRFRVQSGCYRLNGLDPIQQGEAVREQLLLVGHYSHLYGHLTPLENLRFFVDLRALRRDDGQLRAAVAVVGLTRFAERPVRWFSAGMKKRLALARIVLAAPSLLLLDEPYSALDAQGIAWLNGMLASFLAGGGAVVMASHDPARVAALVHRPFSLCKGRLEPVGEGASPSC